MDVRIRISMLENRIRRAEERICRVVTSEDYLTDMKIVQDATDELRKLKQEAA